MSRPHKTQESWRALQKVAHTYFCELRRHHPEWFVEDVFAFQGVPRTASLNDIAIKAGFSERTTATPEQIFRIAKMVGQGVLSEHAIAAEIRIPVETVRNILATHHLGYGTTPYGKAAYGGNRKFSDGTTDVPRRVSSKGQLRYRGMTYTIGTAYRSQSAHVKECGQQLLITFSDQPPLRLTRRRYLSR